MFQKKGVPHATIVTLGCSKNLVDSERIGAQMARNGWEIAYDQDPTPDDTLILNTCGFIGDAKEESIEQILAAAQMREAGALKQLIVMGCLSQRYIDELPKEIPEVDQWYGVHDAHTLLESLGCRGSFDDSLRLTSTPSHYAFLKIAEGCNRKCAFCAIPMIRGKYESTPLETLLQEAQLLVGNGVKELILIAQELTYYGYDQKDPHRLMALLEGLSKIDGLEWIRLHYAYPTNFSDALIDWLTNEPKACQYLDIPLQHISNRILRQMRRAHDEESSRKLITTLRERIPDLALRTTMIVGFPGETEEEFSQLVDFVRETRFDHLGVFTYSEEEGTHAAKRMVDDIPEEVKQARRDIIMGMQRELSASQKRKKVGKTLPVILDYALEKEEFIGRTQYDSPEVDGEVHVHGNGTAASIGDIVSVQISHSSEYDLEGSIVSGKVS